jgi:hypothetical protein
VKLGGKKHGFPNPAHSKNSAQTELFAKTAVNGYINTSMPPFAQSHVKTHGVLFNNAQISNEP